MNIADINKSLIGSMSISPVSATEWEIHTGAVFQNGDEIKIYLVNDKNNWHLSDKKNTLKLMNEMYDLKAPDVKSCISAVLRIYGFTIKSGALTANVIDDIHIVSLVYNFIMCIGQLANMYVFFDKPE